MAHPKYVWPVSAADPRTFTAFGELQVEQNTPMVQIDAIHGLDPLRHQTLSIGAGSFAGTSNTSDGAVFRVSSGTVADGAGVLLSKRSLRYRPGQGAAARFTARWVNPQIGNRSTAGLIQAANTLAFGYNLDGRFGILRRRGGKHEVRTLTVTTAATLGGTITVTLAGVPVNITVAASTTTTGTAYRISEAPELYAAGWEAEPWGSSVRFSPLYAGPYPGTYSISGAGVAGTFAQTIEGVVPEETWTYQEDWNTDKLTGTGGPWNPSGHLLDTSRFNVYSIQYQYLGAGALWFGVEAGSEGRFFPVHIEAYSGTEDRPSLSNPTMRLGWTTRNVSATADTTVEGISAGAFVQGRFQHFANPRSTAFTKTITAGTLTNILTIRNPLITGIGIDLRDIYLYMLSMASDGTKSVQIRLLMEATLGGSPNFQPVGSTSFIAQDTAATTVTGGTEIVAMALGKADNTRVDLGVLNVRILPGTTVTVAASTASGNSDVTAALIWIED